MNVIQRSYLRLQQLSTFFQVQGEHKKELFDQYKNIYAITHRKSKEEALADSEKDQIANRLGRERGRNNPTCDCRILMQDLKPKKK